MHPRCDLLFLFVQFYDASFANRNMIQNNPEHLLRRQSLKMARRMRNTSEKHEIHSEAR